MEQHITDLEKTWTDFGKHNPYWSVITRDEFRSKNINANNLQTFFETGECDFNHMESLLRMYGSSFSGKTVLEFGCGVGRMMRACSKIATKIIGLDISQSHLDLARQAVPNGEFLKVTSDTLPVLDNNPDVIFSLIVLQHNRPPLIKKYVKQLLQILNSGGFAILHIPYNIDNYTYDDTCIKGRIAMEMHCVPKQDILCIIDSEGCILLGEDPTDRCGSKSIQNTTYVIQKPNKHLQP